MTDPIVALIEAGKRRTVGKWYEHGATVWAPPDSDEEGSTCVAQECTNEDSAFIAAAANAVPAIVAMAEREKQRSAWMTLGVGDGSGSLFVHGDYDSIKAVQCLIDENERLRDINGKLCESHNVLNRDGARLEREIERLRAELEHAQNNIDNMHLELAECKKDAERYRWIKKRCVSEIYGTGRRPLVRVYFDAYAATLDEAIDEAAAARGDALAQQKGKLDDNNELFEDYEVKVNNLRAELAECKKELALAIDVGTLYLGWLGVTKTGAMRQDMKNPEVIAVAQQKGKNE